METCLPDKIDYCFFVALNVASFMIYGLDKINAKTHSWRIPEKDLLLIAFFAPAGAWIGMQLLKHKTRKSNFRYIVPLFIGLHIIIFIFLQYSFLS
ncbi:MAG: DUF1294 domain-containing protein [Methanosarcinaceae archaeon]|nr:DUF1294 domain-containing protein [Methanosarcinaceae archaeon]